MQVQLVYRKLSTATGTSSIIDWMLQVHACWLRAKQLQPTASTPAFYMLTLSHSTRKVERLSLCLLTYQDINLRRILRIETWMPSTAAASRQKSELVGIS
jgi:hypothetical protein